MRKTTRRCVLRVSWRKMSLRRSLHILSWFITYCWFILTENDIRSLHVTGWELLPCRLLLGSRRQIIHQVSCCVRGFGLVHVWVTYSVERNIALFLSLFDLISWLLRHWFDIRFYGLLGHRFEIWMSLLSLRLHLLLGNLSLHGSGLVHLWCLRLHWNRRALWHLSVDWVSYEIVFSSFDQWAFSSRALRVVFMLFTLVIHGRSGC